MATAIPALIDPKRQAAQFEATNRLPTEGLRNLTNAAEDPPVERLIVQGLAYAYDPTRRGDRNRGRRAVARRAGTVPADRRRPRRTRVDHRRARRARPASRAILRARQHLRPRWLVHRAVRAGKVPLVAGGRSVFSFLHAYDAATAVTAALDKPATGVLNIVDDDPAPMYEWLVALAQVLGAKPPKSVPARLAAGPWGVTYMTRPRGADNSRAKLALDWKPRFASWRSGFADDHGAVLVS